MNCPICNSQVSPIANGPKSLHLVYCENCRFRGLDLDLWSNPYAQGDYYPADCSEEVDPDRSFIRHRVDRICHYLSSGQCAELGCGLGETAIALARKGFQVDAVEESSNAIEFLKANYPEVHWHCKPLEEFVNRQDKLFDLITLYHVLEHIPWPGIICDRISQILRPDGLLVVEVPNVSGLHARVMGYRWWYWLKHHVNYFDIRILKRLLEPRGFYLVEVEPKYHFSHPQSVLWKDAIKGFLARLGFADVICTYWRKV